MVKIVTGLLLLLPVAIASPAVCGDAVELAGRVVAQYSDLGNYYAAGTFKLTTTVMGSSQDIEAPFIQAGKAPGRMRMEIQHDILGSLVVSDGEAMWTYFKATGQYKKDASVPIDRGGEKPSAMVMGPGGSFLGMYGTIDNEDVSVRPDGYADIEFAGAAVRCAVLRLVHAPADSVSASMGPDSLFVDPETARVLKSIHNVEGEVQGMTMTTRMVLVYADIRMDTEPADELFVFVPPTGATEVDDFGAFGGGGGPDLTGTMAPDFRLTDLDGKPHRLENYRGKVVLLDFWASWCAPCRKELPSIEKFHREYRDKGLVILAINSETQDIARSFIKKNGYTFPVVRDVEGTVFGDYSVSSIPVTVIIDRTGRIAAHFVGFGGEEDLVTALRSAGIE